MTEKSRFWDGTATGDATEAPYDAVTEFATVMMAMTQAAAMANKGGVLLDDTNDFSISSAGANDQTIATGSAQVYGTWYENDAPVSVSIPTPAASTRVDRIVLRKSWASQTVRVTRIAGTEGAGVPALVQSAGTTWDVPLYSVSITTGGVMTVTDNREVVNGLYGAGFTVSPNGKAVGFGSTPSISTSSTQKQLWLGVAATIAVPASAGGSTMWMLSNGYRNDSSQFISNDNVPSTRVTMTGGTFAVGFAPAVAATNVQTYTDYFQVLAGGTAHIGNHSTNAAVLLNVTTAGGTALTTGATQYGLVVENTASSAATTAGYGAYLQTRTAAAAFTQTSAYGAFIENAAKGAGSAITTNYGLYVNTQTAGTTNWGAYVLSRSYFDSGINIGSPSSTNNWFIHVSQGAGTATMYIGNASINVTSDSRLKRGITPTKTAWTDVIKKVQVIDYFWNDPSDRKNPHGKHARGKWTGFEAQQIARDVPELRYTINAPDINCQDCLDGRVCIIHDSYWQHDQVHLIGPLMAAFQELEARVSALGG